mmetsp:Transcript_6305/g.13088  ORF Transcript_6305/g.13088 Transcript_6305/m.13088 type:complete len:319 (+) Transcript_6305:809-1765(+)
MPLQTHQPRGRIDAHLVRWRRRRDKRVGKGLASLLQEVVEQVLLLLICILVDVREFPRAHQRTRKPEKVAGRPALTLGSGHGVRPQRSQRGRLRDFVVERPRERNRRVQRRDGRRRQICVECTSSNGTRRRMAYICSCERELLQVVVRDKTRPMEHGEFQANLCLEPRLHLLAIRERSQRAMERVRCLLHNRHHCWLLPRLGWCGVASPTPRGGARELRLLEAHSAEFTIHTGNQRGSRVQGALCKRCSVGEELLCRVDGRPCRCAAGELQANGELELRLDQTLERTVVQILERCNVHGRRLTLATGRWLHEARPLLS